MSTPSRSRSAAERIVPGGGGAALRGALLIALAVVLGIALLANSFDSDGGTVSAGGEENGGGDSDGDTGDDGEGDTTTSEPATPPTHAPAEVKVWVLNGGGPQGAARTGTDRLIPLGYVTNSPANADPDVTASIVYAVAGYEGDAANIATALGLAATVVQPMPAPPPVPSGDLQLSQVLVILGPDFVIDATATTAAGVTSTTATGN